MTEDEIKVRYKELHDLLSESYYIFHNIPKEDFDLQHGQIWKDMETELIAEGYLQPPQPIRDLAAEVDELKAKIETLEKR